MENCMRYKKKQKKKSLPTDLSKHFHLRATQQFIFLGLMLPKLGNFPADDGQLSQRTGPKLGCCQVYASRTRLINGYYICKSVTFEQCITFFLNTSLNISVKIIKNKTPCRNL